MAVKKRVYRSIPFQKVNIQKLNDAFENKRTVVGIDVAKEVFFAGFMQESGKIELTLKFTHPQESRKFVKLLSGLPASHVECVLEPTGTYGDSLRFLLEQAEIPVFQISTVKSRAMSEVYDGVPSQHDAKSAAILGKLHLDDVSQLWPPSSVKTRELSALFSQMEMFADQVGRHINKLEALMARHWPELIQQLKLKSATLLELLVAYGSPQKVAQKLRSARKLMRKIGGNFLGQEKIEEVLRSAENTVGLPMMDCEEKWVQTLAMEIRRAQKEEARTCRELKEVGKEMETVAGMAEVIGERSAIAMELKLDSASEYESPKSYLKAMGLNMTIIQSGKRQGQLHISKRGNSSVRKYIYFAAMRWVEKDPWAKSWYQKKVKRDGGKVKMKALIALMRKLVQGLWHVGQGREFDSTKLFDTSKLTPAIITK